MFHMTNRFYQIAFFCATCLFIIPVFGLQSVSSPFSASPFSFPVPSCVSSNSPDYLLVVGDVGASHARILFEPLCSNASSPNQAMGTQATDLQIQIRVRGSDQSVHESQLLLPLTLLSSALRHPRVLHLRDLSPNTSYNVSFDAHKVSFHTLPSHASAESKGSASSIKLLFVSCDRWLEDGDDSFINQLVRNERDRFGIVHLGDQIYADAIGRVATALMNSSSSASDAPSAPPPSSTSTSTSSPSHGASFDELLHAFRDLYRRAWSRPAMRRVLRVGAHYMLPDDHEIINNLDPRFWNAEFLLAAKPNASSDVKCSSKTDDLLFTDLDGDGAQGSSVNCESAPSSATAGSAVSASALLQQIASMSLVDQVKLALERSPLHARLLLAGRQAFYEFQYQLSADWSAVADDLVHPSQRSQTTLLLASSSSTAAAAAATTTACDQSARIIRAGDESPICFNGNTFRLSIAAAPSTDSSSSSSPPQNSSNPFPLYSARRFGATGVIFLDLRMQRTFFYHRDAPMLGMDQLDFIRSTIQEFESDESITDIVVASSIPLLFHHPPMADLADHVEKERYATHSHHLRDTTRILRALLTREDSMNSSSYEASHEPSGSHPSQSVPTLHQSDFDNEDAEFGIPQVSRTPLPSSPYNKNRNMWNYTATKVRLFVSGDLHMFSDGNMCVRPPPAAAHMYFDEASESSSAFSTKSQKPSSSAQQSDHGRLSVRELSALFGAASFEPSVPPAHCVGSMVTSGLTRGSTTASSFKLWLFNFANAKLFPSTMLISSADAEDGRNQHRGIDPSNWLASNIVSWLLPDFQQEVSENTSGSSSDSTFVTSASQPSSTSWANRMLPDFTLEFQQFFFGLNYGVLLLPSHAQFEHSDSVFAPVQTNAASFMHPEAPPSSVGVMSSLNRPAGSHASAAASTSTHHHPHHQQPQQPQISTKTWLFNLLRGHTSPAFAYHPLGSNTYTESSPFSPVESTVRTPVRRAGNVVWFAEVGVPLPISWLVLQLVFENVVQLLSASVIITVGFYLAYKFAPAFYVDARHAAAEAVSHDSGSASMHHSNPNAHTFQQPHPPSHTESFVQPASLSPSTHE